MTRRRRDPEDDLLWFAVGVLAGLAWLLVALTNAHPGACQ